MTADTEEFAKARHAWAVQVNDDISAGNLPANAYRLAQTLKAYFNEKKGGAAWPSAMTLAEHLGLDKTTVLRLVRMVEKRGHLRVEWGKPGRGHSHQYWMILKGAPAQLLQPIGKGAPAHGKGAPAQRKGAPAHQSLSILDSRYYARRDSEQLAAWDHFLQKTTGKDAPRNNEGGWYFESEWPPDHSSPAVATDQTKSAVAPTDQPSAIGRWMFLLQRWQASPEQARELVNRLVAVAGTRHPHLDHLFDRMEQRHLWDGKRKLIWLRTQADKMSGDAAYWPVAKKSRPDIGTATILAALQSGPRSKDELIKATGKPATAIASVTQALARSGLIVRIAPGVFGLPAPGAVAHEPARDAVLSALGKAGRSMTTAELVTATGKPRSAIDAALHRLREAGEIVTVQRGLFALALKTAVG